MQCDGAVMILAVMFIVAAVGVVAVGSVSFSSFPILHKHAYDYGAGMLGHEGSICEQYTQSHDISASGTGGSRNSEPEARAARWDLLAGQRFQG